MPWIREFSPALGQPFKAPPHSANYGAGLAEKLKNLSPMFYRESATAPRASGFCQVRPGQRSGANALPR